ncbi:MAG: hypothetical protein H7126_08775 [Candidatus Parcubacteria bacterium]|nr:hypothetical protein [Leptolyngbyaceae cyanobacterium LF-bin-113]
MLSQLVQNGIKDLLRANWSYGQISTLLEIPLSIVLSVRLPETGFDLPRSRDRFFDSAK